MSSHPYRDLAPYQFWRRAISTVPMHEVDPVVRGAFTIRPEDKVVTAGSCFAQHIARRLAGAGFNYFVPEAGHPALHGVNAEHNYGVFSARYGNVYTTRQLLQLLHRAYGLFEPDEPAWSSPEGTIVDPFRPQIQPGGFLSEREMLLDREQHLAAVRRAIEELDVFVFTLGLTETWVSRSDGAAFPVCPGVAGGTFDPDRYAFMNIGVAQASEELRAAIAFLLERNPAAKIILTVSPVPLVATAVDRSVLVSTTYSKSVLRVVAEQMTEEYDQVAYFPSYEVIVGNFNRGHYFEEDLRSVSNIGVDHVMRLFMRHYTGSVEAQPAASAPAQSVETRVTSVMARAAAVICEEELLDANWRTQKID